MIFYGFMKIATIVTGAINFLLPDFPLPYFVSVVLTDFSGTILRFNAIFPVKTLLLVLGTMIWFEFSILIVRGVIFFISMIRPGIKSPV